MTPSISKKPLILGHLECKGSWDMYCIEMPPKVTLCTNCGQPLMLVGHDSETNSFIYRKPK